MLGMGTGGRALMGAVPRRGSGEFWGDENFSGGLGNAAAVVYKI